MDNRVPSQGMMVRVGLAVFGLLTVAILVLTLISERGLFAVRERAQELGGLGERIAELKAENEAMREEIEDLRNPYSGEVERRAREELNLVLPGEVILAPPGADTEAGSAVE